MSYISQVSDPENPYQAGLSVGATPAFVGRGEILEKVNRLMLSRQNTVVLYGQRRIGKTSILMELRENLHVFGAETLLFDLSGKASKSLDDIITLLCIDLGRLLNIRVPESTHAEHFKDVWLPGVLANLEPEKRLVLLFDEFEALPADRHSNESHPLYFYIKSLIEQQNERLFFILTVGRNALDINKVTQGIFKGAVPVEVSLLSERETHELVAFSERNGTLQWSEDARDMVYRLTNGHPYLTQRLCSLVWEEYFGSGSDSLVHEHKVVEAVEETLRDSEHMFDWLWDGLTPVGRVVAAALASQNTQTITSGELNKALFDSGVEELGLELFSATKLLQELSLIEVVSTDEYEKTYQFRVELLRRWIKAKKELPTVQVELERLDHNAELYYKLAVGKYRDILSSEHQPDKRKFTTPISHLQDALESNQNHGRAIELLAMIYAKTGRLIQAQELYERLARLRPDQGRPMLVRILLERATKAPQAEEKHQLLREAHSLSPKSPSARNELKRQAKNGYKCETALSEHRRAFRFAQLTDDPELIACAEKRYRAAKLDRSISEIRRLTHAGRIAEAREKFDSLTRESPDERLQKVSKEISRLEEKERLYTLAIQHHRANECDRALELLLDVAKRDLDYRDVLERVERMSGKHIRRRNIRYASLAVVFVGGMLTGQVINGALSTSSCDSNPDRGAVRVKEASQAPVKIGKNSDEVQKESTDSLINERVTEGPKDRVSKLVAGFATTGEKNDVRQEDKIPKAVATDPTDTGSNSSSTSGAPVAESISEVDDSSANKISATLKRATVKSTLERELESLFECGVPKGAGVSLTLTVRSSGKIANVSVNGTYGTDEDDAECITNKVKTLRMPKTRKGASSLKLTFKTR